MEDLKEEGLESILDEFVREWNEMSQEQKDHLIELFTQADINKPIV